MSTNGDNEFLTKFLTPKQTLDVKQPQSNPSLNNQSIKPIKGSPDISQMTYSLFVNQTKDLLYTNFFKNKTETEQKPKKIFKQKVKKTVAVTKNKPTVDQTKKRELLEEIIKANSESIRQNNVVNQEIEEKQKKLEEKKFDLDNLATNQAADILLENEVEIRRRLLERKHEDIINANLPDIINSIEELVGDGNSFAFSHNKYEDIISQYS